jgi:hypothetical protein
VRRYVEPFLVWPRGVARLGVVACAIIAWVAVIVELPHAIDRLGDRASGAASLTYEDREMGAALGVVADQRALREARALIPPNGRFYVATGPGTIAGATELTRPYIESFATSFLIPRRHSDSAPWVLCYGCDVEALGAGARVVWTNDNGISLVRRPG